jgi:PPM family protein phosphatase
MIRTDQAHIFVAAQTHPGQSGKNNEDNFAISAYTLNARNPIPVVVAIVSDGIGGHRAGEVASAMVVNGMSETAANATGGNPLALFQESFYRISEQIFKQAESDATRRGMGATASCAWILGDMLYIAYAGDSRIYFIRDGKIRQISRDHTWVQEAIEKGILSSSQIKTHPNLHVIRRYLGSETPPEPDLRLFMSQEESDEKAKANQGLLLQPGDVVVLCTDGLTDLVKDAEILELLQGKTLNQAALAMIELANQRGGHDNITVLLLGMPFDKKQHKPGWVMG